MEPTVLSELPDEALYHLLTVSDTEQVLRFRRVLGKSRAPVFREVERYFQEKYGLHGLTLTEIHSIVSLGDKNSSAFRAINLGDFPRYITSIQDQLTKTHFMLIRAAELKREDTALVLLEKRAEPQDIMIVVPRMCAKCLLYFREKYDFSALLVQYVSYFWSRLPEEKILWILETADPVVSAELITSILSARQGDFDGGAMSSKLVRALLSRASTDEVREAYRRYSGGDRRVRDLFEERLRE